MAAKNNFRGALKGLREEPSQQPGEAWEYGGLLRKKLEDQAEQLPLEMVLVSELHDNPYQALARTAHDQAMQEEKIAELADSISGNGFYGALLARPRPGGGYELAYGHRRREAARRAGLSNLPVKIMPLDDAQMARVMASENFSREDLSPLGEANVIGFLHHDLKMSVRDIANSVGKSKGWVQNRLDLFRAPQYLKDMVEARPDSMTFVASLMSVEDPVLRETLSHDVADKGITKEQLRRRIESGLRPISQNYREDATGVLPKYTSAEEGDASSPGKRMNRALAELDAALDGVEQVAKERGIPLNRQEMSRLTSIIDRLKRLK